MPWQRLHFGQQEKMLNSLPRTRKAGYTHYQRLQ